MPRNDPAKHRAAMARWLLKPGNAEAQRASKRDWKRRNPQKHARSVRRAERRARERVFEAGEYRCHYCSIGFPYEGLTVDHIVPTSRGGDGRPENLVPACHTCNRRKGAKTASEFRSWLRARGELPSRLDADGLPDWSLGEEDSERALRNPPGSRLQ